MARVVDFFWRDPDPEPGEDRARRRRAGQLASRLDRRALAAKEAGCEFVIVQGIEAGGHIRGKLGLLPLLSQVLDQVTIPVLTAGGIGSPRGLPSPAPTAGRAA